MGRRGGLAVKGSINASSCYAIKENKKSRGREIALLLPYQFTHRPETTKRLGVFFWGGAIRPNIGRKQNHSTSHGVTVLVGSFPTSEGMTGDLLSHLTLGFFLKGGGSG